MFYYFLLNINFTEIQASNAPATIKRLPIARHVKYIIFVLFCSSISSIPSIRGTSYEAKMSNPPSVIATNEIEIQVTKDASIIGWFLFSFLSISRSNYSYHGEEEFLFLNWFLNNEEFSGIFALNCWEDAKDAFLLFGRFSFSLVELRWHVNWKKSSNKLKLFSFE